MKAIVYKSITAGLFTGLILLAGCQPQEDQSSTGSINVTHAIAENAVSVDNESFLTHEEEVGKGLLEGGLTAYESFDFEEERGHETISNMFSFEELIEYYPDPDDPHYVADSVIIAEMDYVTISRYSVMEKLTLVESGKLAGEIKGIAPRFRPVAEGQELAERRLAHIKPDDLQEYLGAEAFAEFISELLSTYKTDDGRNLYKGKVFSPTAVAAYEPHDKLINMSKALLNDGLRGGALSGYKSCAFEEAFSEDEIEDRAVYEEIITYHPDPDDPYYMVDSVVQVDITHEELVFQPVYSIEVNNNINLNFQGLSVQSPAMQHEDETIACIKADELREFFGEDELNAFTVLMMLAIRQAEIL